MPQEIITENLPPWLQVAIALGIPGTAWLIAKWSARHAVDARIEEKMKPVHTKLDKLDGKVNRILGHLSGPDGDVD